MYYNHFKSGMPICCWDSQSGQSISSSLVPIKTGSEGLSTADSSPLPIDVNVPASAFPSISQHLCTCTPVSESTATSMLEKYQQLPSSSAVTQQQSAPAQPTDSTSQILAAQASAYQ
jgi:hypothetical protein